MPDRTSSMRSRSPSALECGRGQRVRRSTWQRFCCAGTFRTTLNARAHTSRLLGPTAHNLGMVALKKTARRFAAGPKSDATSIAVKANVFRREGEFWAIAFPETSFSLRDSKGLLYIARLLAVPDTEIHALDLVSGLKAEGGAVATQQANVAAAKRVTSSPFGAAGEVLDQAAREEYRQRLADIDAEIAEADWWNDSERAVRLQVERDFLIQELANATGLGGRTRNASSASERARISVTKATWAAMDRNLSPWAGARSPSPNLNSHGYFLLVHSRCCPQDRLGALIRLALRHGTAVQSYVTPCW